MTNTLPVVSMLVGFLAGSGLVLLVWWVSFKAMERALDALREEQRALVSMLRSQNRLLASKDLSVFTALTEAETPRPSVTRRRDDATEAALSGNGMY